MPKVLFYASIWFRIMNFKKKHWSKLFHDFQVIRLQGAKNEQIRKTIMDLRKEMLELQKTKLNLQREVADVESMIG